MSEQPGTYRASDEAADVERLRLAHLETLFDEATIARLSSFGLRGDWACLDVGAGSGSVAAALAASVAPTGRVVATDVDLRFLAERRAPNLETREHDLLSGPPEEATFDLVHARGVLEHLRERDRALDHLVAAARPGGWVVVEDVDWVTFEAQQIDEPFASVFRTLQDTYTEMAGYDGAFGRRAAEELRQRGLVSVDCEGRVFTMRGGEPSMEWYALAIERAGPILVDAGLLSAAQVADALAQVRAPDFAVLSPVVYTAWGQRP